MGKYNIGRELLLRENTSHSKALGRIKPNSMVLEFGPAGGAMTEYLRDELNCQVYIVELDKDDFDKAIVFAKDGLCGNASDLEWLTKFSQVRFDYILFMDILEHLYDPDIVLKNAVSLLRDNGRILVSVPNIAHSSIIINLLQNKFEYKPEGLLDNTHIRFFTYYSLHKMLDSSGLTVTLEDATYMHPNNTEFSNDYMNLNGNTDILKSKKFEAVYQFVFESVKTEFFGENEVEVEKKIIHNPFLNALSYASVYFDTGDGFSEADKILIPFSPGKFSISANLTPNVKILRFDPVENALCAFKNLEIFSDTGYLKYENINGYKAGEYQFFLSKDPQFLITPNPGTTWIRIEGELVVCPDDFFCGFFSETKKLSTQLHQVSQEVVVLQGDKAHLQNQKNDLQSEKEKLLVDIALQKQKSQWEKDALENQIEQLNESKEEADEYLNGIISRLLTEKEQILQSKFWRMTKPARIIVEGIKRVVSRTPKEDNTLSEPEEVVYNVELCEYDDSTLRVEGWGFHTENEPMEFNICIAANGREYKTQTVYGLSRKDVYALYQDEYDGISEHIGFCSTFKIEYLFDFTVNLEYIVNNRSYVKEIKRVRLSFPSKIAFYLSKCKKHGIRKSFYQLRKLGLTQFFSSLGKPRFLPQSENVGEKVELCGWLNDNYATKPFAHNSKYSYSKKIDIILPVYNGFEYLDALFKSIPLTELDYNLYVVEDCSTDARVLPLLDSIALNDNRITILKNEKNLGFVKSVNKGLNYAKNHVVLINSDIELPQFWLERLMYPILFNEKVASSTPFTNAGTLNSFPVIGIDNPLFEGLTCNQTDEAFSFIKPMYATVPTGMGFCMGMNRDAINEIGILDEIFAKGYGEENDWCQRAINAGYSNVMVENLFVYHKHGGSFSSAEKDALIAENSKVLAGRYPNYNSDVSVFFAMDVLKPVREIVSMRLLTLKKSKKQFLVFDHNIGGGATDYLNKKIKNDIANGYSFITVRYDASLNIYLLQYQAKGYKFTFKFSKMKDLKSILSYFPCGEIIINELVTYPNLYDTLDFIAELKKDTGAKLQMLLHDYYAICPSVTLLDSNDRYCAVAETTKCEMCLRKSGLLDVCDNISEWRKSWAGFLSVCDEIIAFSNASLEIFETVYGENYSTKVIPHKVDYVQKLNKPRKSTNTINIGVLGAIGPHKGANIITKMLALIPQGYQDVRIIIIGYSGGNVPPSKYLLETGKYKHREISELTIKHDIDIFFISSVWPETFSYTTEEVIKMGMPVCCFNLGAPAERVAVYEKGLVIDKIDAKTALEQIKNYCSENK
ncbi:MAG: methyltransferase domain-containing protein [Defluviitaleaceae bacterium]|nr:methyltransferase domain-containing protein [Defluviitaleaceae bacterium]MCL2263555.1 methyltransferase domain-containing protein [Defluviitaleaceae bacterium]